MLFLGDSVCVFVAMNVTLSVCLQQECHRQTEREIERQTVRVLSGVWVTADMNVSAICLTNKLTR